jgi:hypothetical protein
MIKPAISRVLIFVLLALITVACKKTYSVKIINNYPDEFSDVNVGPASFGTLASGTTSSYKEISEGSNALSGNDYTGDKHITGTVSMSGGIGKNTGTVTINSDGSLSFAVDKK